MPKVINVMLGRGQGGLEKMFVNYALAFSRMGHDSLGLCEARFDWQPDLTSHVRKITLNQNGQLDILAVCRLQKIFKEENPDIIISHGNRALHMARLANLFLKIPHVFVIHNYRCKSFCGLSAAVAITRDIAEDARRKNCQAPLIIVPNFLLDPFAPRMALKNHRFTLGFLGRHVPAKGVDILLHALARLVERGIKPHLLLAGHGPQSPEISELIGTLNLSEHVQLLGWVSDKKVFFDQIDALVVPSRHEPFGLIYLEAWQHGVPVITTPCEGGREIIQPDVNGLMSQDISAESLAQVIERAVKGADLLKKIGQNSAESYSNYSWPKCQEHLGQLIRFARQAA